MIEYNLRSGDLLIKNGNQIAVLTRQTKKFCYYFYMGKPCRISKEKLWFNIDCRDELTVVMKDTTRRRKQRKMRTLNLHGIRHEKADEKVRKFLNFIDLPCKIVTGDSSKMKRIVNSIVEEYGWSSKPLDSYNFGTLIISE